MSLSHDFVNPVILAGLTQHVGEPHQLEEHHSVVRIAHLHRDGTLVPNHVFGRVSHIRNASCPRNTKSGQPSFWCFDIMTQEPLCTDDPRRPAEPIEWLAVEAGAHLIGRGPHMFQAGTVKAWANRWRRVYPRPFGHVEGGEMVVQSQVQTTHDMRYVKTRQRADPYHGGGTNGGWPFFLVRLEQGYKERAHGHEAIGWAVVEAQVGSFGTIRFESMITPNIGGKTIGVNYKQNFRDPPFVFGNIHSFNGHYPIAIQQLHSSDSTSTAEYILHEDKCKTPNCGVVERNINFTTGEYFAFKAATKERCCVACRHDTQCFAWVYAIKASMCSLKDSSARLARTSAGVSCYTGYKKMGVTVQSVNAPNVKYTTGEFFNFNRGHLDAILKKSKWNSMNFTATVDNVNHPPKVTPPPLPPTPLTTRTPPLLLPPPPPPPGGHRDRLAIRGLQELCIRPMGVVVVRC